MEKAILVVDDEKELLFILKEKLSEYARNIYLAANGAEALSVLASKNDIGVIVSDIRMPEMDGISFIKEARNQQHQQPFIFFTAYASREILNEVARYGVFGFIEKDEMAGLEEAVISALDDSVASETDIQGYLSLIDKMKKHKD